MYITPTEHIPSVYSKRETFFFGAHCPSVKPSVNVFFVFPTDIATECGITDKRYSVGNIVGKYFTDERSITHQRNMSVGKTVKSCSVLGLDTREHENQYNF